MGRLCPIEFDRLCHKVTCDKCEVYLLSLKPKIPPQAKYVRKPWLNKKEGKILFEQLDNIRNKSIRKERNENL